MTSCIAKSKHSNIPDQFERIRPWDDEAADCRCLLTKIRWNFDEYLFQADEDPGIPQQIARARPGRRAEFVAGRRCAGQAVRLLMGGDGCGIIGGFPVPNWPKGIVGAISHSQNFAVALVGRSHRYIGAGIDIEKVLTASEARDIFLLVLSESERKRLETQITAFTISLAFSLKESLFKSLPADVQADFGFDACELTTWGRSGDAILRVTRDLGSHWRAGTEFAAQFLRRERLLLTRILLER
ncbi:4'-phosphopantetheinyl transferase [Rhodomicrobium udaipurense JA643]|uniref:Enterobactin synthase component D n=1 Tax=Rhodomicrobium udaipurense TaxID=1202716 RepID=A0A8I1GFN4_9HYPH|nr:4'-phosphopantetheinyl transferase superfamily protein [Rhodomicrobium udaipurense]KAI93466.1 4'-phosphopantetheinyl transferase [Rhodomicrobium udaipurense JA643]MBJ7543944.1 4'-phosphopantetheinyl transferase superfamily protein [Rhodomicrobium udaipurense]